MKVSSLLFVFLFGILSLSFPFSSGANEPQQPAKLNVTYPAGWELIATDGQGSRWFLYKGLKETISPRVFRVQLNMLPSDDNQAFKDAGVSSIVYLMNVDCDAGTLLFVEFTGYKLDGTTEHYVFPSTEQATLPSADSALVKLPGMVCK